MQNDKNAFTEKERVMERQLAEAGMPLMRADVQGAEAHSDSVTCPHCGAVNEPGALFCENCGRQLRERRCPMCGALLEDDADYCERCHQYVDAEHCSFCHAMVGPDDQYCPDCGASLAGIECPVCHTVGKFGFCEACGTPLTDSARIALREAWQDEALAERVQNLEQELEQLWMTRPVSNDQQRAKLQAVMALSQRVKELIAQEVRKETSTPVTPIEVKKEEPAEPEILTEQELQKKINSVQMALQSVLDEMAIEHQANPAHARNVAMARKPKVSRLAWKCNYKHALHTSPLGCACPHHGGKWVVLDGKSIVSDN